MSNIQAAWHIFNQGLMGLAQILKLCFLLFNCEFFL